VFIADQWDRSHDDVDEWERSRDHRQLATRSRIRDHSIELFLISPSRTDNNFNGVNMFLKVNKHSLSLDQRTTTQGITVTLSHN